MLFSVLVTLVAAAAPRTRAVTAYIDNTRTYIWQARALYASWFIIKVDRLPIDLIFFVSDPAIVLGDDLECGPYTSHNDENDCFIVYMDDASPERRQHREILKDYKYLQSIVYLESPEARFLRKYDYLMRTDADAFLTPAFVRLMPTEFQVGNAGYGFMYDTQQMLIGWSRELGLRHNGVHNVGETQFGPTDIVLDVCRLTTDVTVELLNRAFTNATPNQGWPRWHRGVASMYGLELAINHLVPEVELNPLIGYSSSDAGNVQSVQHIHCQHTDSMFSKFAFDRGLYQFLNVTGWDTSDVRAWSLSMALRGPRKIPFNESISTYPAGVGHVRPNWSLLQAKPDSTPFNSPTPSETKKREAKPPWRHRPFHLRNATGIVQHLDQLTAKHHE